MGDRENEFRNQLKNETNDKSSIPDNRSAQQRAIDGARKMTPRDLKTTTNSDPFEKIEEKKFRGGFIIHSNKEDFEAKKRLMEAARREAEAVIAKKNISLEELKE